MVKKRKPTKRASAAQAKPADLATLITEVRDLIQSARRGVASVVDTFQVMPNFEISRRIVEHEQKGAKRAAYGAKVLKELSARLTAEFGRGFSIRMSRTCGGSTFCGRTVVWQFHRRGLRNSVMGEFRRYRLRN